MALLKRVLLTFPLLLLSPFLMAIAALALAIADLAWSVLGTRQTGTAGRDSGRAYPVRPPPPW